MARRVVPYLEHTPLRVPVPMRLACLGVICPVDQTCVLGACVPALIDATECASAEGCGEGVLGNGQDSGLPTDPWAVGFGDTGPENGRGVSVDAFGNIYVTGDFDGNVNFGGEQLVSAGGGDTFVASFTSDGTARWAKRFGVRLRTAAIAWPSKQTAGSMSPVTSAASTTGAPGCSRATDRTTSSWQASLPMASRAGPGISVVRSPTSARAWPPTRTATSTSPGSSKRPPIWEEKRCRRCG